MAKVLADALVPIFAGLLLGYIAGLRGVLDNQNVRNLITFVMSFAVPCSLFLSIAQTPRAALREQAGAALVLLIVYAVLYAVSFFWARSSQKLDNSQSADLALTVSFPNSAAVGLALLVSVYGPQSVVTVATSIALGSITISAITLAILDAERVPSGDGLSVRHFALSLLNSLKKPIVWAPLAGLVFSCAGLQIPSYASRSLTMIGTAASGSALVLTGLVVSAQKFDLGSNTFVAVFLKNLLQPGLALGFAMLFHLSLPQTRYVTLLSAIPCGFFGIVFGKGYDVNPKLASSGLIESYVLGVATLAAWIVILNHIG
jgi:malonate transporter and related proteins